MSTRKTMRDRFFSKVDKKEGADGCWLWSGATRGSGVGVFTPGKEYTQYYNPSPVAAHRMSYFLHTGHKLTRREYLRHTCGNTLCINPNHLKYCVYKTKPKHLDVESLDYLDDDPTPSTSVSSRPTRLESLHN